MILYGRNLSPFVRRVAVWLDLQNRPYTQRPIAVLGEEYPEIQAHNPTGRVPILILDDGTHLIETLAICDYLDETAAPGLRLVPERGPARLAVLQRVAMAQATAEKAVALFNDRNRRPEQFHWQAWQDRLVGQIRGGLAALDAQAPAALGPDGGDVAAVLTYDFVMVSNPWLAEPPLPRLAALAAQAARLPAFAKTQPPPP